MALPTGITISFDGSGFSAALLAFSLQTVREDYAATSLGALAELLGSGDLYDGGELALAVELDPDTPAPIAGDVETITIAFPVTGSDTVGRRWRFQGFLIGYETGAAGELRLLADLTVKLSGAIRYLDGRRLCRVAPSGQADYTASSTADRARYGWIAGSDGDLGNGDPPYVVGAS